MLKVYLAARYDRRSELRKYRDRLEEYGIAVTSRWLDEQIPETSDLYDSSDAYNMAAAIKDLNDVDIADSLIIFSENPTEKFGYALKGGKDIIVIGPKENIFHYCGEVTHFNTFDEFITSIETIREEASYFGV
jgi:hypothetical protein